MWNPVTKPYAQMLSNHIYPALFGNVEYRSFLEHAGIKPPYPRDVVGLSPLQRKALSETAEVRACLLGLDLQSLETLEPSGAHAVELSGPLHLYRLWNSEHPESFFGFFWFTEKLLRQSYQDGRNSKKDRLEWLRGQLAVADNWSRGDRVAKLTLGPGEKIPAVEAIGLPVRRIDNRPRRDGTVLLPEDYFEHYDRYSAALPGGVPQIYLFLLPERVERYWG
jgi:hypothetical protein